MSGPRARSISEVVQTKRGRGRSFGNRLSRLLREAMELRQAYHRGEAADFAAEAERLRREAVSSPRPSHVGCGQLEAAERTRWHHDRGNLLRFLDDPSIEPTNNRSLRPAVRAEGIDCLVVRMPSRRNQDPSQWRRCWSTGSAVCSAVLRSPPLPSEPLLALRSATYLLTIAISVPFHCLAEDQF